MKMVLKTLLWCGGMFLAVAAAIEALRPPTYDEQKARLTKFVEDNRTGSDSDMWIIKRNLHGENEKVGLIFGYVDDEEVCRELIRMYTSKYFRDT